MELSLAQLYGVRVSASEKMGGHLNLTLCKLSVEPQCVCQMLGEFQVGVLHLGEFQQVKRAIEV